MSSGEETGEHLTERTQLQDEQHEAARESVPVARALARDWQQRSNPTPEEIAHAHHIIGVNLGAQGKLNDAVKALQDAVSIYRKNPTNEADMASTLTVLAFYLMAKSDLTNAEAALKESLDIYRKIYPDNNPEIAASLHELARCLLIQGQYQKSEDLFRQTLSIKLSYLPEGDINIAFTRSTLAVCLIEQFKLPEAQLLLQQAVDASSPTEFVFAKSLHRARLAFVLVLNKEHPEEVEKVLLELEKSAKLLNSNVDKAKVLCQLGEVMCVQSKWEQATKTLRHAHELQKTFLDQNHHEMSRTLYLLGESLLPQNKQTEAEELFKAAVEMQQQSWSLRHPQRGRSLLGLGRSLCSQNRWEEAKPYLKEAVAILTDSTPHHPRTAEAKQELSKCEKRLAADFTVSAKQELSKCITLAAGFTVSDFPASLSPAERYIYERALRDGDVNVERTTIKLMGRDRVGKTCFADSLADKPFCADQPSTDTVTVRTMITSADGWNEADQSDTEDHLNKTLARGVVLHQQQAERLASQRMEYPSSGHSEQLDSLVDVAEETRENLQVMPPTSTLTVATSSLQDQTVLPADHFPEAADQEAFATTRKLIGQSGSDEAMLPTLMERFRTDPDMMQHETSLKVVKVLDLPGQPLFWTMLPSLMQITSSPYDVNVSMILFNVNRSLSDPAEQPVFVDGQYGPLVQRTPHFIERESDYIRHSLMLLHVAQVDPPEEEHIGEIEGVLSPAVFAIATHIDEEGAEEKVSQQNKEFIQILEESGYDAHVVVPSKDSDVRFFTVDNTKSGSKTRDTTVHEICMRVERMSQAFWQKKQGGKRRVPLRFMRLEKLMYKLVSLLSRGLIKVEVLKQLAKELCHIRDDNEFLVALKSLTSFAVVFYFPEVEQLNQLVVMSPQWLFSKMAVFTSVEKPQPSLQPDWRRLKKRGIMSWKLAVHLLKANGVREDEYCGVLQLFRLMGIISPRQDAPSDDMTSPIAIGSELFVPSMMEEDSAMPRENVGLVDNPSPDDLPPTLVFYPNNVDIFPEVLFFRFIALLLSHFPVAPQLKRSLCIFNLPHNLVLKVVFHTCRYVTATLSSVSSNIDMSKVSSYSQQLFQLMSEQLNKARHPGMAGFRFDVCVHLPTDSPTSLIQPEKLIYVNDYTPGAPLVCRAGRRVADEECRTLPMWFTSSWSDSRSPESIIRAVTNHGASRWYAIGRALGCSSDELTTLRGRLHSDSDIVLAIVDIKTASVGKNRALDELVDACRQITNPIIGAVEDELKSV